MKKRTKLIAAAAALPAAIAGLAAYLTAGRRGNASWSRLRGWRYAHRGYHNKPLVPENSIPAFAAAIEHGWGAELDVHLLKDGTLAVFHDSDLMRCTGTSGIIEDLTLDELRELRLEGTDKHVPLFDEVLELFEGRAPLIIELKPWNGNHRALARAVCRRLDTYRGDFCIESFDPRALAAVRRLRPEICRGQLAADFMGGSDEVKLPGYQKFLLSNLLMNFLSRPDFIAYRFEDRRKAVLRLLVSGGVQEVSWTIRSKEDLLKAEEDGSIPIFECFDPEN
ncbi:MAG: glycerophosphodiester phosphodiesterase [Lachnospiraceae bacterium]|nr:glycerophosphodiester phosphodiesterase [Lachnospiraceae bacterium]